jgi:hypothetical protein
VRWALPLIAASLILAAATTARSAGSSRAVAAIATGFPGPQVEVTGEDGSSERRQGAVDVPGLRIARGEAIAESSLGSRPRARAIAVARTIEALDGVVKAYGARRAVTATGRGTTFSGRVTGLMIGDDLIGDVTKDASYDLPDHSGRVIVNHGTIGIRILMRREGYGFPAGADIRIAVAESRAEAAVPNPVATPEPTPGTDADQAKAERAAARRERKRRRRAEIVARISAPAFQFPVFGQADVADDWGGPRQIGPHQGNDVFAPFGTPVLAVADGTLSKVGTLPISGNRLWLTTGAGDAFFYAHLSSFSPAAVTGRRVAAGTVLGFTGNTGDAEPTPPHVHFEIHPGGEERKAVDPHEILMTWLGRRPLVPGGDTSERPGALVEVRDFIAGE